MPLGDMYSYYEGFDKNDQQKIRKQKKAGDSQFYNFSGCWKIMQRKITMTNYWTKKTHLTI